MTHDTTHHATLAGPTTCTAPATCPVCYRSPLPLTPDGVVRPHLILEGPLQGQECSGEWRPPLDVRALLAELVRAADEQRALARVRAVCEELTSTRGAYCGERAYAAGVANAVQRVLEAVG